MKKNISIIILFVSFLSAQEKKEFRFAVSYVSASVVYIDAGREQQMAVGDTVRIYRSGSHIGTVVVTAVSRRSSAAQIISQSPLINAGDGARIEKIIQKPEPAVALHDTTQPQAKIQQAETKQTSAKRIKAASNENIVSGRFGVQYSGVFAEDSRFNLNQPSSLLRLDVQNVYGTGLMFSMYGRTYYDLSNNYNRYGENSRIKTRLYEFVIQHDQPDAAFGYGVGRMTSRYVGGLGTFDGGHLYVRQNDFTAGILLGARVQDRTMAIDGDDKKGAVFVNYRYGADFLHQYDGTIAYGRQLVESNLDREFLYLQNSVTLGPELSLYESTEIELNEINNGKRSSAFNLSNTFLSVNYYPNTWLSTNVGYDATRSIYLFETMKAIPDTLFDKNIMQGFHGSATVRLPYFISVSGNATFRTKKGDARDAYTLGGTARISDIAGSEINAGIRYANITGVYSDGSNITFDVDRTFFSLLSVALRYDYYKYTILSLHQTYTTQTATVNANYRISRMLYSALTFDSVFDATMNSYRVFAEVGIRF